MRKTTFAKAASLCAIALCLAFSISVFAQSDVGTITGFVRDQSGAVVPNAKVSIKSEATNEGRVVTTDASGHYAVPNLLPGLYTMSAEASGFKKFNSTHNKLEPNSTVALDGNLAVGATSETVEVSSTAEVLQTESGSVQNEITGQQIQNQELNGRSPIYSAQFLPGIRSIATRGDKQDLGPAGQPFSINGSRSWDTMVTVDGAPALRTRANGAVIGVGVQKLDDLQKYRGKLKGAIVLMDRPGETEGPSNPMLTPFAESNLPLDHPKNMALMDFRGRFRMMADEAKLLKE